MTTALVANFVGMTVSGTPGTGEITLGQTIAPGSISFATAYGQDTTVDLTYVDGVNRACETGCIYNHASNTITRGYNETSTTGTTLSLTSNALVFVSWPASKVNAFNQMFVNVGTNEVPVWQLEATVLPAAVAIFSAPAGIVEQYLLADSAKISAAVYDAAYFGFQAGIRTWPIEEADEIIAAPDSSAAARELEDFIANWATKTKQPLIIRFGPGLYKFDTLNFKQNAEVFYPRNGLILQGAGSNATKLVATVSSKAQFIGLDGKANWVGTPVLRGLTLVGAGASNPYQVGVFLNPEFVNSLGFGGMTSANWQDVHIRGFAREQLWLKGGSEDYLVPIQFGIWEDIVVTTTSTVYPAFRLSGQIGTPYNFKQIQCYGVANTPAIAVVGLDLRTSIPIASSNAASSNALLFSEPHRFKTGDRFKLPTSSGTAWGGLSLDTDYWAYRVDDFSIKVCTTYANATNASPTFVSLNTNVGTASASSAQATGVSQCPSNVIFETLTLQTGIIGMDVTGTSLVYIDNLHGEETNSQIRVSSQATVNVHHASHGNSGSNAGTIYDASSGGSIHLTGIHSVAGTTGKLISNADGGRPASGPDQWVGTYYPTTGAGITGKLTGYFQLGNDAEIDISQRVGGEYLLNTGTTVMQNIKAQAKIGQRFTCNIWSATGSWLDIGIAGNINLLGKAYLGSPATMRIPVGSSISFICTAINHGWMLDSLQLPVHTDTWTQSGDISANSSVSKTVTCPGARVGDVAPSTSISVALTAGLILVSEVTATDTVTVRIVNPTTGALAGPTNPTVYVKQQR